MKRKKKENKLVRKLLRSREIENEFYKDFDCHEEQDGFIDWRAETPCPEEVVDWITKRVFEAENCYLRLCLLAISELKDVTDAPKHPYTILALTTLSLELEKFLHDEA